MAPRPKLPPRARKNALRQLLLLIECPYKPMWEGYAEHGPLFRVKLLGQPEWTIAGDPELVRLLFKMSADEAHGDSNALRAFLGPETILFKNGEDHRRARRVLTPPFKHQRLGVYAGTMIEKMDRRLEALRPGERVTVQSLVVDVSLATIMECIFGVVDEARSRRLTRLFSEWMHTVQHPAFLFASMALGGEPVRVAVRALAERSRAGYRPDDPPLPKNPVARLAEVVREIDAILFDEIARARAEADDSREDVLAMLVRARYEDGSPLADDDVYDQLVTFLVGGHETTSMTMSWVVYFLLRHPAWWRAVKEEADALLGDRAPGFDDAQRVPITTAVIEEAMRLRPVAANVPRVLTQPLAYGGYEMPAGTRVFPSPSVLHFREDLWPDPHRFDPTRFLEKKASPFEYLPFGGGSRSCLGKPFAMLQMRLLTLRLVQRAELELAPDCDPKPAALGILTGPSDGVPIVVRKVRSLPTNEDADLLGESSASS